MNVRKVLLIEGSVNLLICLSKLSVGLVTGSSVIIADALHSLADVANNLIAWMAIKIANPQLTKTILMAIKNMNSWLSLVWHLC